MTETQEQRPPKGFRSYLPVPFVKGSPRDYQRMSVDELRRFINFMYKSKKGTTLPNSTKDGGEPPDWWLPSVSFDKNLKVNGSSSLKGLTVQQKELCTLVRKCYESSNLSMLLAIGNQLTQSDSGYSMRKVNNDCWDIINPEGLVLVTMDNKSKNYDATSRERRACTEKESEVNCEAARTNTNKASKKRTRLTAISKVNKKKVALKRKIFDDDEQEPVRYKCTHCGKDFSGTDFRDEHQEQCLKGPFSKNQSSQTNFMSALGMFTGPPMATPSVSNPSKEPPNQSSRNLRKLPKRNHVISILRNHPLPITTDRGQRLIKELGDPEVHRFPPTYERYCVARSGFPMSEKKYPTVTKRAILKHSEYPHIYSYRKRQRVKRYQELVIGLNRSCWKLLNSCKRPKLVIDKLSPEMKHVVVPQTIRKSSYLERKWRAAIAFPRVKLVDFKKNGTVPASLYVQSRGRSPKPGTSKSSAY